MPTEVIVAEPCQSGIEGLRHRLFWMAAVGPGLHARWAPRGNELYYRNPEWDMMAVSVQVSPEFPRWNASPAFSKQSLRAGGAGRIRYRFRWTVSYDPKDWRNRRLAKS